MQTKLKSRKWKSLVSGILLADSASSFLIAPVFAAEYTDPLTGIVKDDKDIIRSDGNTVKFNKSTNTVTYDFKGQDHTFNVKNHDGISTNGEGYDYDYVYNNVGADDSKGTIYIRQSNTTFNPYEGVNGFVANGGTTTINSNLDITATSDYASVGVTASGNGTLIINGNVKMRKDDPSSPWGIITKNVHGNVGPGGATSMDDGYDANYTGARWQPSAFSVGYTRGNITVNGDVDVAVRGTAVNVGAYNAAEGVHPYDLATVSLVGDSTRIITPYREKNFVEGFDEFIEPYYSLACYGGTINVNVKNMEAQKGKVKIVGNIMAMKRSEYTRKSDVYQDGRINLALTTSDSSWKGIIDNTNLNYDVADSNVAFGWRYDPDMTPVYADHSGEVNLWLQNGAQWIYENASRKDGLDYSHMPQYSQSSYGNYDGMSHLSRLVGGKDSASAGIIRVNDSDPIQIAEAEGVTKVWYEHADATPGTIIGGDVKVLNAKTGTEMMLYTGNNGITKGFAEGDAAADKNNVSEVLNSLAHKLWYMAGDSNLKGSVSIAEGLTASSATMKTGNITFAEGGQGFYDYTPEKDDNEQSVTEFTQGIFGKESHDTQYVKGNVLQNDGTYRFTKDSNITIDEEGTYETIDGSDNAYDADVTGRPIRARSVIAAIADAVGDNIVIDATNKDLSLGITARQDDIDDDNAAVSLITASGTKDKNANVAVTAKNLNLSMFGDVLSEMGAAYMGFAVYADNNSNVTLNSNVNIQGIDGVGIALGAIGGGNGDGFSQNNVTVKGDLAITDSGAGIYIGGGESKVVVKGKTNIDNVRQTYGGIQDDPFGVGIYNDSELSDDAAISLGSSNIQLGEGLSAVYTQNGTININNGADGTKTGTTNITGNLVAEGGIINLTLADKDSSLHGLVQTNGGKVNLDISNGAVWDNKGTNKAKGMQTKVNYLSGNNGYIYQNNAEAINVANYSGAHTVVYEHDEKNPTSIIGGNFNIAAADANSVINLVTDNKGIASGYKDTDAVKDRNTVSEVLNKLAQKLFYTANDGKLTGSVKIADGLTASSATLKSGDISFSTATTGTNVAGQGFYDYTPATEKVYNTGAIKTSEDISTSRELDASGVAHVTVTESNAGNNKFASAIYAGESTSPSSPMTVKMSGKGLALNAAQSSGQAAAIYTGANNYIKVINPSADQKLAITANNTDTKGAHGIYADGNAHLNISGVVEISDVVTKGDAATGINIQGQKSEINIDGPLTISNVKGIRERGNGINASGILVTGDTSSVAVTGPVDISGVRGSGIRLAGKDTKVSVGGGNITAAEDSDKSHNFYAVRVEKGTLDINMKDGAAGDTTTTITGDMYATGQYGKKVMEYTGGELINWNDAGILNVALTNKDSFWKGVAAYDQYNDDYGSGGNTAHDIGQFNLYLQNGATWTNEQQSHVTTTTIASKNPVWTGSTLASLHGGKDAAHAGHIFQNDSNNLTIVNYSGNTNIYYAHEGNGEAAENYKAGDTVIKSAVAGSSVSLITDNKNVDMTDNNSIGSVLNALAGKLTYSNFASGEKNLVGYVKIADGLTASSAALKTGDISFDKAGKGFYDYTPEDSSHMVDPITGNLDKKYVKFGIETEKGIYNFTQDTTIDVTKGDYSSNLGAIESSGGPITINADGYNLDVSYHVLKGSNVARAVATGLRTGIKDVTIKAKSLKLSTDTTGFYGQGVYATGGKITIDADTTISTSAQTESNGIYSGNGGTVTMNGNLDIHKDSKAANYIALKSDDNGVINVNMKDGKAGAGIVKIDGDIFTKSAESYDYWEDETTSTTSTVNLALQGKDSSWNGRSLYKVTPGDESTDYGVFNLWLTDGATWTNEKNGKVIPSGFTGSRVTKFTGGSDAAHAGNIFQNDKNTLTIDNYSGNTNIYYAHTGNGEAAGDYKAGDTIIKHAEKDSVVSLITDNKDVNMNSADSIVNVLNSLAGKLTYSNFTKDENNLTGYVKIADGLTSSSAAMYTGDMAFSKEDGKGSLKDEDSIRPDLPAPDHQIKNEFTTTLTGVKATDKEYYKAGVIKGEGLYQFTENSSITTTNAHVADMNQATTIDVTGKTLTFNTNVTSSSTIHAIGANSTDGVTITADKLVINGNSTNGRIEGINVGGQGQQNKDNPMKLTINGDTEMNIKGIGYTLGLYAAGNSEVTFNGNVTAMGNKDSEWGLTSKNGAWGYYGCSLVYSGSNYSLQMGPKVTINGDVNAKIDGNCLFANGGHAKLTINGGGNIEINKNNEHTYYVMIAESGTTSMNVNLDANYDAISARENKLVLKGNVGASTGAMNANEPELYTKVNLGLATADSVWTGVAFNGFKDEGNSAYGSDKKFYGAINVFLQNGATWNNEKWGETVKGFKGSHVAKFVGGSDAAHAGNIFQNDANNITIDSYSGNTNIYYAHTGNGEAADNYAAGDTIIRSAAEGSVVSLITDNSGISMDNEYSVANVLNTMAGKLTYSKFVNGEKNLAGYVKIADGLTASSAAMQTGNIAFNADTGKGSLENGSLKPGFTYPETQVPESNKLKQGITGDAKADYQYKKDGILKEDGSYVFTQDPTKIEVESGAAVSATKKNINIDTTKAKLELKGETGIKADGADVNVKGNTSISGNVGINAENGNVTLNGSTNIEGTDAAINAGADGNVDINTNNSALNIKGDINANGGNITVDSGNATGTINGDVNASNGGNVEITLNDAQSKLTGSYNVDEDSSIVMNIKNGAVWELTDDDDEAEGMSLLRMAKAPAAAADKGLTINGGESKAKTGYLNMTKRTKDLKIASYSGWETIIYAHENAGSKDEDYKNGNTIINKAAKDSGVILSTDNSGINMNDKAEVEATLKALAHKLTYNDHKANGSNLTGMVQIADGLTASSASKYLGNMSWDKNGKGQYIEGSVNWREIYNGNYETFVMKGVRSAATTSMHSWRDNMQDTYTGADLADADGIFAKALGGKTSSDVKGVRDDNTYRGVQVGFDKALANGWHAGAAFDYRNGDSNYLLGGKGDNQLYSFGVYGVKNFEDQSYLRVAAKAGRVENEYDVYNEIRSLKLHGDYKSNAYGLTMEYGKTFGTEASYFTPKAQLTWSQVGAKDYTAHTPNDSMSISQDAYSSLVARFGVEAGAKSEKGRVYVGLYGAHEFNGDISASYFAKDGGTKYTSFDGKDTWMEMSIGGSYDLSDNCHIYADFAKDFKGDFERKWKLNAGLRFEF